MAEDDKKKKKKGVTAEVGGVKIKVKAKKSGKPKGEKKSGKAKKADHSPLETLAKLAESPIVADIIAVGATAAVAALATKSKGKDGNAVKHAGKAAAAAIGRRLMEEFDAVKSTAAEAAKKV